MSRILLLLVCLMCFSPALHAQGEPPKIACYASEEDNAPHKRRLWDGYEISLGPVANPLEVEYRCTSRDTKLWKTLSARWNRRPRSMCTAENMTRPGRI